MGYKIEYTPEDKRKYPIHSPVKNGRKYIAILFVVGLLFCVSIPKLRNSFVQILIPGDDNVTKASFGVMIEQLQEGEPMLDAVTTFCQEILNNGKK